MFSRTVQHTNSIPITSMESVDAGETLVIAQVNEYINAANMFAESALIVHKNNVPEQAKFLDKQMSVRIEYKNKYQRLVKDNASNPDRVPTVEVCFLAEWLCNKMMNIYFEALLSR